LQGGNVAVVFNVVLSILAGICFIGLFFFLIRALSARSKVGTQAYEVGRVETRQKAQANLVRAFVALVIGLLLLGVMLAGNQLRTLIPQPTPTPTAVIPTAAPTATVTPTNAPTRLRPSPTSPLPTATTIPVPSDTPTPAPLTATVSSGVGVYLRADPSVAGAELEYLPDGAILLVLPGQQTADELQWQQVSTEDGLVGWVASDFVTINQP
jgi:Bacterial SH3 domain